MIGLNWNTIRGGLKSTDPSISNSHTGWNATKQALLWNPPATPEQKAVWSPSRIAMFPKVLVEKKNHLRVNLLDELVSSHIILLLGVESSPTDRGRLALT